MRAIGRCLAKLSLENKTLYQTYFMKTKSLALKQRIESHIKSKEGCWLTDYAVWPPGAGGRPKITVDRKTCQLARIAYEVFKNESPGELCVCHTCDNPSCINPEHLWLGTYADNNADKVEKNRQLKGSQVLSSKLTESQVEEIKQLLEDNKLSIKQIARQFELNPSAVQKIDSGTNWKHLGYKTNRTKKSVGSKLNHEDVVQIKTMLSQGISHKEIANLFGVTQYTIYQIKRGDTWKNVTTNSTDIDKIESSIFPGKLTRDDVVQIKTMLSQGVNRREIANLFGVSRRTVGAIALGDTWKSVTLDSE